MIAASIHRDFAWPYAEALAWMRAAADELRAGGPPRVGVGSHDADVVTLGRHTPAGDLVDEAGLREDGIEVFRVERGGGATAHGPGQLVVYPVVDLRALGLSIPAFTGALTGSMLAALGEMGIAAEADVHGPGVYVGDAKIGSVGFRVERGVVTHGLALNVANDLYSFDRIAVCGRRGAEMTRVIAHQPDRKLDDVAALVLHQLRSRCVLG